MVAYENVVESLCSKALELSGTQDATDQEALRNKYTDLKVLHFKVIRVYKD